MSAIGLLVRVELKRHLGAAADDTKTCLVMPPADWSQTGAATSERAFAVVADALHEIARHPFLEEVMQRRVAIADLRPFRNSLLLEKDGWKCYRIIT